MRKRLLASVLFLTACAETGIKSYTEADGKPHSHAIQSAELRELMHRMDNLMQESFMTEYQVDKERRKYALRIASGAENLSKAITEITLILPSLKLDSKEQFVFLSHANKLDDLAWVLHKQARQNQIDAFDNTMRQIDATCASCHALFRKPKD